MFTKGIAKIGGRRKGTANKLTSTFREAVLLAYENIGGHEGFSKWAAENRTEFYRVAARLIPAEAKSPETQPIRVVVYGTGNAIDQADDAEIIEPPPGEQSLFRGRDASHPGLPSPQLLRDGKK